MQRNLKWKGAVGLFLALSLSAAACGGDDDEATDAGDDTATTEESSSGSTMASEDTAGDDTAADAGTAASSAEICDTDALVEAVESGAEEGTLAGMTDDPVATAASNNPVLTTLVAAVTEANLVDTLNSAPALTVFAPTDCAFAGVDPATLDAAMADPSGLLTNVLGFHVVPGEQLSSEDLAGMDSLETFTGATLPISVEGDTVSLNGGTATVLVPDIQTANATVHLIDEVMLPPDDATAPTTSGM